MLFEQLLAYSSISHSPKPLIFIILRQLEQLYGAPASYYSASIVPFFIQPSSAFRIDIFHFIVHFRIQFPPHCIICIPLCHAQERQKVKRTGSIIFIL
jgi:hypothetical protein